LEKHSYEIPGNGAEDREGKTGHDKKRGASSGGGSPREGKSYVKQGGNHVSDFRKKSKGRRINEKGGGEFIEQPKKEHCTKRRKGGGVSYRTKRPWTTQDEAPLNGGGKLERTDGGKKGMQQKRRSKEVSKAKIIEREEDSKIQ